MQDETTRQSRYIAIKSINKYIQHLLFIQKDQLVIYFVSAFINQTLYSILYMQYIYSRKYLYQRL